MPLSDHSLFWNMTLHTSLLNSPWSSNSSRGSACGSCSRHNHNHNHNHNKDKGSPPPTVPSMSPPLSSLSIAGYNFPFTNSHPPTHPHKKRHPRTVVSSSSPPIPRATMHRRPRQRAATAVTERLTSLPQQRTHHHHRPQQKDTLPDRRRGRRVTFGTSSMTLETLHHPVLSLYDYTESEVHATWYDKEELRAMKQQCRDDAVQVHSVGHNPYDSNPSSSHDDEEEEEQREDDSTAGSTWRVRSLIPTTTEEGGEDHECVLLLTHWMNRVSVGLPSSSLSSSSTTTTNTHTKTTRRGLESKSSEGAIRKKRHRAQAWLAVLSEQRRQRRLGIKEGEEAMADAYFEVSDPCHVAAHMMGIRDAREVLLLWASSSAADRDRDKENRVSPLSRDNSLSSLDEIMRLNVLE